MAGCSERIAAIWTLGRAREACDHVEVLLAEGSLQALRSRLQAEDRSSEEVATEPETLLLRRDALSGVTLGTAWRGGRGAAERKERAGRTGKRPHGAAGGCLVALRLPAWAEFYRPRFPKSSRSPMRWLRITHLLNDCEEGDQLAHSLPETAAGVPARDLAVPPRRRQPARRQAATWRAGERSR